MDPVTIGNVELAVPVIQGGMAVKVSMTALAATVSQLGGLGVIGGSGMEADELREQIRIAKGEAGKKPIGVNLMVALTRFHELVRAAVEEGTQFLLVGAGFSRDVFNTVKGSATQVIPIVSSLKAALVAERLGASAIVVEGGEAGGHLGTSSRLLEILAEITSRLSIPVFAAGGIVTQDDVRAALALGADGVQVGTRFALTPETDVHPDWQHVLRNARPEDIVIIESPAGLPGRAVRTKLIDEVEAGRRPTPRRVPRCIECLKKCSKKFCIIDALLAAREGDMDAGLFFTGARVVDVPHGEDAREVFEDLVKGFNGQYNPA